ncbi:MAG: UDP-N-acetylmuramate--L-alanine ligase [Planctomycetes bacterium]|nr:UDP-N-acetylmuramate--L-alanine ligase [Planctomycetota bacterium]
MKSKFIRSDRSAIHIVGVGGSATSGLARLLVARGHRVSGSDGREGRHLAALRAAGLPVHVGHHASQVPDPVDLVVSSAAVPRSNPEICRARELGARECRYAELLGELLDEKTGLAVAGTHGKTTTAGFLTSILVAAGRDPEVLIGGYHSQLGGNCRAGRGPEFVVEACEFNRSFHALRPRAGIITCVEHDHPDVYGDDIELLDAFETYVEGVRGGPLLCGIDSPMVAGLARGAFHAEIIPYGFSPHALWQAESLVLGRKPRFRASYRGIPYADLEIALPGRHNVLNALAAVALAAELGVEANEAVAGVRQFSGVDRRFQRRGDFAGISLVDDYAHHPTEVRSTIEAARDCYPGRRVWAVFQPHQWGRLQAYLDGFATALSQADRPILLPVYSVREKPTDFSPRLLDGLRTRICACGAPAERVSDGDELLDLLERELDDGDVCLMLGAGDIVDLSDPLADRLSRRWDRGDLLSVGNRESELGERRA